MAKTLNPALVPLIYDALLRCFWRKEALKRFLRSSGIAEEYLSRLDPTETKRAWLDRLFQAVPGHERGADVLAGMARSLAAMEHFPDLADWEDATEKQEAARRAVTALADALGLEGASASAARATRERRRKVEEACQAAAREAADLETLRAAMEALVPRLGTQQGGYDFQDWFYDLLDYEDLDNRRPYTVAGRQIDGSVTLDGTTYLIELKFEASQAGGPDIDSLKAKVGSKADNTMGIMVAMAGYSSVAINEASGPRTALLLLDSAHIYMVLVRVSTLKEVIRRVRRHSSQTGRSYLPPGDFGG